MPALPTHLVRVGAMYKYRSRIPTDLLAFYAPKHEITESLLMCLAFPGQP